MKVQYFLIAFIDVMVYLLIARIVLSWLPTLNWQQQPWRFLYEATEPLLAAFRGLIPPIGMMDLSPLVLFFLLYMLKSVVSSIIRF